MTHWRFAALSACALFATQAPAADRSGEAVYNCTCIACHGSGYANAPRYGDKQRWSRLIKEGLDDLVPAALAGERGMPAKGGNPNLSDLEVARAVVYMANAAGAALAEPTAEQTSRWRAKAETKIAKRQAKKESGGTQTKP